ncbi:MAG: polyprenyl synthetase family protein [Methylotenera sp.]|nr:polyprenyl synthetase family protein [Methylotenera sp.]MDD4926552.1 polyprenyl synthetase family protein [Methylotenera sp.]
MTTKWFKKASRKADARKVELLEVPLSQAFLDWTKTKQAHIESVLERTLPPASLAPQTLHRAMRYSALGGGKRIRALLCYASAELCNTEANIADATASAVELIHAYSLVHDDMPCMDDDDLRRGKPSCHKQFDDATALLVGDALQTLAFEVLSAPQLCENAKQQINMINILAKAAGSYGMAGGQAIDLSAVGVALTQHELETMHQLKTGALIQAAVLLGANGSEAHIAAVSIYAKNIGLAFQVIDDILDVEADTHTLGKTAGKDVNSNKPTYVTILGLADAKKHAGQLHEAAIDALAPFGDNAQRLRALASFITQRSF